MMTQTTDLYVKALDVFCIRNISYLMSKIIKLTGPVKGIVTKKRIFSSSKGMGGRLHLEVECIAFMYSYIISFSIYSSRTLVRGGVNCYDVDAVVVVVIDVVVVYSSSCHLYSWWCS